MTINRYSHSVPPPAPELAVRRSPPRVLGPGAGDASAASGTGAESGTGAVEVESGGLLSEPTEGELPNDELESADRLGTDGATDGLAADPVTSDATSGLGLESAVSLGVAPMMVSSSGNESPEASLTEVIEARQRM